MNTARYSRSFTNLQSPGLVDDRPTLGSAEHAPLNVQALHIEREALDMTDKGLRESYGRGRSANQVLLRAMIDQDLGALQAALQKGADPNLPVRMRSLMTMASEAPVFEDAPLALLAVQHWGARAGEALDALRSAGADFSVGVNIDGGYALVTRRPAPIYAIGEAALQETLTPIDPRAYAAFQKFAPQAVAAGYLRGSAVPSTSEIDPDEVALDAMLTLNDQIQQFRDRERGAALKDGGVKGLRPA